MNRTIFLFLLVITMTVSAQTQLSPDTLASRLWKQARLFPNEKIYLHTDRSVYSKGDTIWFRAYLANAVNNQPELVSRYVYAELIDPFGSVVKRVKIRQDQDKYFDGYLPIDAFVPVGEYVLRAYTRYMENAGEEFFFRKPIHLVSPFDYSLETDLHFDKATDQSLVNGAFAMKNLQTGQPIVCENVKVYDENGILESWSKGRQILFKVLPDKCKRKVVKLEAGNYERFFPLSLPTNDYHVDFFPEGGNLPAGVLSKMAFKALNKLGLSEKISGVVQDETGKRVCCFETTHAGMGCFNWIPEAGKKYYAECISSAGVTRTFDLPVAQTETYSLRIVENRGVLAISLLTGKTESATDKPFTLILHERGIPLLTHEMFPSTSLRIEKKAFSSGVLHCVLVSPVGKIVSERLVFVKNDDQINVQVTPDKGAYKQREKVCLSVSLQDTVGHPVSGNFSVSVTDNADILSDSSYTIYSSFLLSSDLRGYIENPGWYFQSDDRQHQEGLDLLMLTQGWRRYCMEEALMADYVEPVIAPEMYQRLTGQVKRLVGNKVVPEAKVQISVPSQAVLEERITDINGIFELSPFEFPDSTWYRAQAFSKKGSGNVLLTLDKENFPKVGQPWPFMARGKLVEEEPLFDNPVKVEFISKSNQKMAYENGQIHFFLDEVIVSAKRGKQVTPYESILGTMTIKQDVIEKTTMELPAFLVASLPGISINFTEDLMSARDLKYDENRPSRITHGRDDVMLILNEFPVYDPDQAIAILQMINMKDIKQIDYNRHKKDGLSWFSMKGAKFIAITLKEDIEPQQYVDRNMQQIRLLGYQKPAAFYSPKYETMQQKENPMPDLRTTLYWNPKVQTDEQGNASVEFYTADSEAPFSVVVEGITDDGRLIRGKW